MRYVINLFLLTFFFYICLYIFILSIDPYNKFNINFWNLNTKAVSNFRNNKFRQIDSTNKNYELFLLGSSRIQRFDPEKIKKIIGLESYNYGVNNANPEDLLAILKHIVLKQKTKVIFLQVDFYMLNENIPLDKKLYNSPLYKYLDDDNKVVDNKSNLFYFEKSYITFDAIKDSFNILIKNKITDFKPSYKKNGMLLPESIEKEVDLVKTYFKQEYYSYKFSKKRISYLNKIKEICDNNNIELVVSISPMNKDHLDLVIKDKFLNKRFIEFKRIIVNIFDEVFDFNNEYVSNYYYPYWMDSIHPSENLTDIMIEIIFDNKRISNFGYILNKQNIEKYLEK